MFKFSLNESVLIEVSLEHGTVVGRAEYCVGGNSYLIRHKSADGRAVQSWWDEDAITKQG